MEGEEGERDMHGGGGGRECDGWKERREGEREHESSQTQDCRGVGAWVQKVPILGGLEIM